MLTQSVPRHDTYHNPNGGDCYFPSGTIIPEYVAPKYRILDRLICGYCGQVNPRSNFSCNSCGAPILFAQDDVIKYA